MGILQQIASFIELPPISKFKMTSIQWDSQQFYLPPPPAAIPSSTFSPPSHSQAGADSTYFQPSIDSARFEEVKRTTTHGAPQNTSSSYQAELPPDQGRSLHGIKEITQDQDSRDAAVVSNAETEMLSIGKPLLLAANRDFANVGDSLDSVYGPATDSNQVNWGTSQDKPILLDSDVGSNGEFDNVERGTPLDLTMRDAILSHSHPTFDTAYIPRSTYNIGVAEPTGDEGLHQVEASSILSQNDTTIATEMNGDLFLASQNIESPIGLGSVQETSATSVTEGIPTNEGKIDKYQPKSRRDSNDYISAENDHMDKIELSFGMTRSDDRDGSTDDGDGEDHANDSSGFDIEHPQRLKRRRRAKSTESSAQTNFSNVKDVTFPTNFADVLSQGKAVASSDSPPTSQHFNGGGHADDSDSAGSEIQERRLKRPRRAKSTESSAHMSSSNVKEASIATANSSYVSTPEIGATSSDSPLESHEIPIRGSLTLQTFQSGIVYCLKFSQEELPFPLEIEQAQDVISSASSGDRDRERPHLQERVVSRPGRHSTYSEDDDELLIQLKEKDKLPWDEIAEYFPERTKGTLQVHYCTKLKNRSQTSKYKKRKITNSAKESGERYPSRFSMDLHDPQLQDALPSSTSILPATADSTEDAHGNILSITPGNIESTEVQPLRSSQGVESNLVAIDATEGRWEVEALLAKSKLGNVIWYLVKWTGFRDEDNTWQKRDDISSDLISDFEASYRGNYLGVQLLKKRERRGKIEYFVEWKGRPAAENSWEKEVTVSRERILEFEAM